MLVSPAATPWITARVRGAHDRIGDARLGDDHFTGFGGQIDDHRFVDADFDKLRAPDFRVRDAQMRCRFAPWPAWRQALRAQDRQGPRERGQRLVMIRRTREIDIYLTSMAGVAAGSVVIGGAGSLMERHGRGRCAPGLG